MAAPVSSEQAWPMRGKLSRGGTHYILTQPYVGSAPPSQRCLCVMLHGLGSWSYNFDAMAEFLSSKGYTALQLDNIGMGHSTNAPEDIDDIYSPKHKVTFNGSAHIDTVHELLKELGLLGERYVVVGHSMGGALATLYAEKFSAEIRGVILLSPSGLQDAWRGKAVTVSLLRTVVPSCLLPSVLRKLTNDVKNIANIRNFGDFLDKNSEASEASCQAISSQHKHNKEAIKCFFNCVRYFPFFSLHKSVSAVALSGTPVLLLHGDQDDTVPPMPTVKVWSNAIDAHKVCPLGAQGGRQGASSSRVQLVGGGHMFFLENTEPTFSIIAEWLGGL